MEYKTALTFFKNKRVFLTGHTGFKGSWLTFLLLELGADVKGYALDPDSCSHYEFLNISKSINDVRADVRDAERLKGELIEFEPEIVIHLAAQALVRKSYDSPKETFETNLMGSVNLLEAVKDCQSVRSLVFITSDKCYENLEWVWGYRENDLLGGHDPYSASKAAAEIAFSSYLRSFLLVNPNFGAASARAGNVIGGGDWSVDRIVPDCIRSIQGEFPLQLRNPNSTRPWQHVLEPISGYLLLAYNLCVNPKKFSGAWNFGPGTSNHKTVYQVASQIMDVIGLGRIEIAEQFSNLHEANLLQLNCDKAHQILKWAPRWNSDKTVEMTAQWYKSFLSGSDVKEITRKQLLEYFEEIK